MFLTIMRHLLIYYNHVEEKQMNHYVKSVLNGSYKLTLMHVDICLVHCV